MKVLCVHGIGGQDADQSWQQQWEAAIVEGWRNAAGEGRPEVVFVAYDDIFARHELSFLDSLQAVGRLLGSGARHGWDWFRGSEGVFDGVNDAIRWTAGMVVQWVENDELRGETRQRLLAEIDRTRPDALFAHSLGSLIAYDTLTHPDGRGTLRGKAFVSLGSQIGNPFVAGTFLAGRIEVPPDVVWYHLYNQHDDVFTAPLHLGDVNFTQIDTPFDLPGFGDHDAVSYLSHDETSRVWRVLAAPRSRLEFINASAAAARRERKLKRAQRKRALLVGINDYPDPRHRLEGCVNDVFLMSSVLQELDFSPEQIRVVLNDRATAEGIRSRLQWLLEGAADGDQLVFYYSGHGIRLPAYGAAGIVDRIHECLVPHDFDGSLESAVSDEHICGLYSQLPYETFFAMVLDCCHSGGVSRSGGPRARGLDPPDDIRHRMLYWDRKLQMWRGRKFEPLAAEADEQRDRRFAGDGASFRLGRAIPFRQLSGRDYRAVQAERNNRGPYMPVVLEACRADELAFEYRHGGTSYGAFTYVLAKALRQAGREQRRQLTYRQLVEAAARELKDELGYDQTSSLAGPSQILDSRIPWKQ